MLFEKEEFVGISVNLLSTASGPVETTTIWEGKYHSYNRQKRLINSFENIGWEN